MHPQKQTGLQHRESGFHIWEINEDYHTGCGRSRSDVPPTSTNPELINQEFTCTPQPDGVVWWPRVSRGPNHLITLTPAMGQHNATACTSTTADA